MRWIAREESCFKSKFIKSVDLIEIGNGRKSLIMLITRLCSLWNWRNYSWMRAKSGLRASSPGHSGGGAGKERRACNYVSGIWISASEKSMRMLIGGDDISNHVITLGTWFSMFVYIRARFRFHNVIHFSSSLSICASFCIRCVIYTFFWCFERLFLCFNHLVTVPTSEILD